MKTTGNEELNDALQRITDEHALASLNKPDHVAEVSYFCNEVVVDKEEVAALWDEPLGSHVPVIVVVAHGKKLVDKIIEFLGSTEKPLEEREKEPTERIQ